MSAVTTPVRGRPVDPELQAVRKNRLLDAAQELLVEKSYRSITIRDIAQRADMKSAMIGYYFGGKEQLFVAMVERTAEANFNIFTGALGSEDPIRAIIKAALNALSSKPFIIRLLTDEILVNEGPLREAYMRTMPMKAARVIPQVLKQEQLAGRVCSDLDPRYMGLSLISLLVLPFLGAPFRRGAWGLSDEEVTSKEWAEHIYQLFMKGAASHENNS